MKLKTMLLGTAATLLITASSAYAHEAPASTHKAKKHVVVKHVAKKTVVIAKNACSIFGPGFINVPGTSSCLKLYGKISGTVFGGSTLSQSFFNNEKENKKHIGIDSQGRIGVEAYAPSSLGTVHARIEARGDLKNGLGYTNYSDAPNYEGEGINSYTKIHYAYAELGGLRLGVDESIFNYWANNFSGVENDAILNPSAHTPLNAISYTFSNHKGMSAILGLESSDRDEKHANKDKDFDGSIHNSSKPERANLVAGVKFDQAWGDIIGVAAYDGFYNKSSGKLRIDGNINNRFSVFGLAAVKSIKDSFGLNYAEGKKSTFTRYSNWSPYGDWDGKWEAMIGGAYVVNPNVTFNAQAGYTAAKTTAVSADFVYEIAKNFTITPELSYVAWNDNKEIKHNGIVLNNHLKGKHQVQALVELSYKF